ncbi:MAG: HDIG domain-containing protein [Candidatus Omnitrophica bacterium]|nr:HDIG domain-containing protein [Candidatus Omnitrophota bacterium]MDD5518795.1 HDIG domain-containing protein [Candidatus Omnitrophota bacterium]
MIKLPAKINFQAIILILLAFIFSYVAQINLAVTLFLVILCGYLKLRKLDIKCCRLINLSLLFLIIYAGGSFIIRQQLSILYIPFSIIPMLATLLFGSLEVSLLLTLASAVALASFSGYPLQTMLLALTSGTVSSFLVLGARKRSTIIRAGILNALLQIIVLVLIEHLWIGLPYRYLTLFLNGIISSIIVLGVLSVFEYLFNTATNISLLELADFHHPLLQRMVQEAPGTYHHSLIVGNLSETACRAVGANALLARIGAYYHDIGKLQKPEYFSENQNREINKHGNLSPTMSKLVIMNHVKEGLELAKRYRLNPALIDFIQQHHGNSLVYYFYRRALENIEKDEVVKEEGFRYPGPKPNTKETAIVLLADSVEAAMRTLREPSPAKIEELVHKVINNKFIDGQLDECELTLKDLEKISAVFIRLLCGIYHSRTSYPEGTSIENNHKKPSKEGSHLSGKDKKINP